MHDCRGVGSGRSRVCQKSMSQFRLLIASPASAQEIMSPSANKGSGPMVALKKQTLNVTKSTPIRRAPANRGLCHVSIFAGPREPNTKPIFKRPINHKYNMHQFYFLVLLG